jgi:hypothetical protein
VVRPELAEHTPATPRLHRKTALAHQKPHLPQKTCVVCGRPFAWRKKWSRHWDEITTCSQRCNGERRRARSAPPA